MSAPVVLTRRGLLARVFLGAWLLALVASAIARAVIGQPHPGEALQTPVGAETPEAVQGPPPVAPAPINDLTSHAL